MLEMRWLHRTIDAGINQVEVKLQYRTRVMLLNIPSGELRVEPTWGEWVDVPNVSDKERDE